MHSRTNGIPAVALVACKQSKTYPMESKLTLGEKWGEWEGILKGF
jgi:hypothetical protein